MNKKGFTLIELMAVIVVLAIITVISVPIILNTINISKEKLYKEQENKLVELAEEYLEDNTIEETDSEIVITKENLIEGGYIDEIYDFKSSESTCEGYISITNYLSNPMYKAYISCDGYVTEGFDSNKL